MSSVPEPTDSAVAVPAPRVAPLGERFRSASGLRPVFAFVLIGAILALVLVRSALLTLAEPGEQPANLTRLPPLPVTFDLCAADGTPMAVSVEYLELVMSPNAMWQAHTPDAMAQKLAACMGEPQRAAELLGRMLPDAEGGWITVRRAPLVLDLAQAQRAWTWIQTGTSDAGKPGVRLQGIEVVDGTEPGRFTLRWAPAVLLSEAERQRHGFEKPLDWTKRLADDLIACLCGESAASATETDDEWRAFRARVWSALMPTSFRSIAKEVPVERARELFDLLREERVQAHQMELKRNAKRLYPVKGASTSSPPVAVLGRWGTLEPEMARRAAARELGLAADESTWSDADRAAALELTSSRIYQPSPMSGIELAANTLFSRPEFAWVERHGEEYVYLANQAPRQAPHRYFQALAPASETPRVVTTIEIGLQRVMRRWLEKIVTDSKPAVVQAIAIDVATGDVLAVDAIDPYDMGGFVPTLHTFTPGSTLKIVVMASALEAGVVQPDEQINSFNTNYRIEGRPIAEAEGATNLGVVSAAEGLAFSVNAVLVQIGTRVSAAVLHDNLLRLGYASAPRTGMGTERAGYVTPLPWKKKFTHASVCFGHELLVTLWQHAAGLASVVRGGEYRPLRFIRAIEQGERSVELALVEPQRVFSPETARTVREMMSLGAKVGTGRRIAMPDVIMGTKTGTAEKVAGELCLHAELQHNREHGCRGARECRIALKGHPAHRGRCYTSSMCVWGHLPDGGREVMVLVVVDEPRGTLHFGSEVAGPAAAGILREALGLTRGGEPVEVIPPHGFREIEPQPDERASEHPWLEVAHASG